MHPSSGISKIGVVGLAVAVALVACSSDDETIATTSTSSSTTTLATTTTAAPTTTTTTLRVTTTTTLGPPPVEARYVVADDETVPEAKQLATDIALALTTYEPYDDPYLRYLAVGGLDGFASLAEAAAPLTRQGYWSRGTIVYPQLGGLTDDKVSVMTVTRQTVGSGPETAFTLVRTLDIRLVMGESGWEFDELASAGGVFETVEDLTLAHVVAADPRIEMPDSARLDILNGDISPRLLELMLDIADITPFGITVMKTGHPYHVFETDRVSHHTGGRAIDINLVGDRHVIDDRTSGSITSNLVDWLWKNPMVIQVGSPMDVDGGGTNRSFENTVHQDHIHVAVIGPNDPTWYPAIGNRVWEDRDGDGIQDEGEPGIGGVTVTLFNGGGSKIGSTTTSSTGQYEFRNLYYGTYRVGISVPSGYFATKTDRGSDDSVDSDINASGMMASQLLGPREYDVRRDAGLYRLASIGNRVWEDLDADGIQDDGEPGFPGIQVHLYDGAGALVAQTTTDSNGNYEFENLVPGIYSLEIFREPGYVPTLQDQPFPGDPEVDADTKDSDFDENGVTETFALYSGRYQDRWDAGLVMSATVGDLVWDDLDGDGIQDGGEPGMVGVRVRLFQGGVQVASTVTAADGTYSFDDLVPGGYQVRFVVPEGYVATLQDQGGDDAADSDIDAGGIAASTTLDPGEVDRRWDAGFRLAGP